MAPKSKQLAPDATDGIREHYTDAVDKQVEILKDLEAKFDQCAAVYSYKSIMQDEKERLVWEYYIGCSLGISYLLFLSL